METTPREKLQNPLLLWAIALGIVLLILLAAVFLLRPGEAPGEPTLPTALEETLPPKETLLPPEANPYGPNDFQYDGKYLTCLAGESILGIDVSEHQLDIDWEAVREAGIEFVIIRAGGRGYSEGVLYTDARAQEYYAGAKAAGLKIGAYFFSQALDTREAVEEALLALEITRDWELDFPLVYDWEYISADARTADMTAAKVTSCAQAFCRTVSEGGRTPMVYFNPHHAENLMDLSRLKAYDFWLAMYSDRMTFPYRVDMWQYTCQGQVPGIEVDVDINLYFPLLNEKLLSDMPNAAPESNRCGVFITIFCRTAGAGS